MTSQVNAGGLVGRGLAAVGALLLLIALFQAPFAGESRNIRELYDRLDVLIIVAVVVVFALLILSFFAGRAASLFVVAILGACLLGLFLLEAVEFKFDGYARGWYLGLAGAGLIVAGASLALLPTLLARGEPTDLAFLPAEPTGLPDAPEPGWYPDPAGQARLRYWDGQGWSEQTQS